MDKKEKLTPEEEQLLIEFRDRYLKYGLCTDPANRPVAEEAIKQLTKMLGDDPEKLEFRWYDSPKACHDAIQEMRGITENPVFFAPRFTGQLEAYWIAYYQFVREIGVKWDKELQENLDCWDRLCQSTHIFWYTNTVCFMSDRPNVINMVDSVLHKDGGPSIQYRDGWSLYSLHGVAVPKWLAMTPAGQVPCEKLTELDNAEVRREFVRKVGYERICHDLGAKVLDEVTIPISRGEENFEHTYRVLELHPPHGATWRMLEMLNPSLSTADNPIYHLEGIPADCDTVVAALHFRKPVDFQRYPVNKNGADWYQQGDVIMYPEEVTPVKPFPAILT